MPIIIIAKPQQLFELNNKDELTKNNLTKVINGSRNPKSGYWEGEGFMIGNPPIQGINWIGKIENNNYSQVKGVIVKAINSKLHPDGWIEKDVAYKYCFRLDENQINYQIKPNMVLIQQKSRINDYPILLFTSSSIKSLNLTFEGKFKVEKIIAETAHPHVILTRL